LAARNRKGRAKVRENCFLPMRKPRLQKELLLNVNGKISVGQVSWWGSPREGLGLKIEISPKPARDTVVFKDLKGTITLRL